MNQEKLTIGMVRKYLRHNLFRHYPERELNAIITIILGFISGKPRRFTLSHPDHEISSYTWFKVKKICDDLKNMVPVQYITGASLFYGIKMEVTKQTMIPRQETEELVEIIIKENKKSSLKILDICTGTGCIAISLALNIHGSQITATDYSDKVLQVAKRNATQNSANISLIKDDILNPDINKYGNYDIVVCNPPYITESEKAGMGKNVLDYEPHEALFVPDNDALLYYKAALDLCRKVLNKEGRLYFEINESKASEMKKLLTNYGHRDISIVDDINGMARITKSIKI